MIGPAEIAEAKLELVEKSIQQIQYETAMKWLARAMAAYSFYLDNKHMPKWLFVAAEYATEALEHAALVGDDGGACVAYTQHCVAPIMNHLK